MLRIAVWAALSDCLKKRAAFLRAHHHPSLPAGATVIILLQRTDLQLQTNTVMHQFAHQGDWIASYCLTAHGLLCTRAINVRTPYKRTAQGQGQRRDKETQKLPRRHTRTQGSRQAPLELSSSVAPHADTRACT